MQNDNFDDTIKPLVPTTRSCNSLMRQIKYNINSTTCENNKVLCLDTDEEDEEDCSVVNGSSPSYNNKNQFEELLESHQLRNKENVSHSDKQCMDTTSITNLMNSLKNKLIGETNNYEIEQSPVVAIRTAMANGELFPVQQQSSDDEMLVNVKKSKPSEKSAVPNRNETLCRFDTSLCNNINRLNYNAASTSTSHQSNGAGCSYMPTRGSKRNQFSSFSENIKNKKLCRTKSKHDKNVSNSNPNQIIDLADCQNLNNENIGSVTINNDSSVLENPMTSQDINGVPRLMNEPSVKENNCVTKASHPELSITAVLNMKDSQSNFTVSDKDESIENCASKIIDLNSDQDSNASPSSDIHWPTKSHSDPDSPESKPMNDNSEQIEIETTSSDTEHLLSLRNSEKIISKLVSSLSFINENKNTQIYTSPMDPKLSHAEHSYVENVINSNTRDLEVVNVLSPVSINSTDIPMNKSSWAPDISLVHVHNDHNDIDCDHSQSSLQQLNGLCNSININTSCGVTNQNSEVEHLNSMQLETPTITRSCSYNRIETRIFPEDSYTAALSPSGSSVSNSAYGSAYDVNRIPVSVNVTSIPVTMSPKDVTHELNDSNNSMYHNNTTNVCFNGLKKKSSIEQQSSYNCAIKKSKPTDMSIMERVSSSHKDEHDVILDVVSDEFSDVDSLDLRINSNEPKDINLCVNNLSMSSLISTDLKSINTLNSFEKCGNWSTIKNPSDTPNHHQNQKLKIYTDPTEIISMPVNQNAQSVIPINLNEAHVQKVFLRNQSPPQVYYNPMADFHVSSDMDMANHGNIEDPNQIHFKNRPNTRSCVNMCPNDKYHPMLQPTDNDPNVKQTLINGHDGVLNQHSPIVNNVLLYNYPRSDSNPSIRYENPPLGLQYKNPERISPLNGIQYSSYEQIQGPSLLEDPNQNEEQSIINMAHLMQQSSKNCKVHYKWPLNKNKSQTSSNKKHLEASQTVDYQRNPNVLYKYPDDELNQITLSPNEIPNENTRMSFNERINNSTLIQPNQQFQDLSNFIAPDHLSPTIQSGSDSISEKTHSQSRSVHNFENNSQMESTEHQEMYRNTKILSQSKETSTSLGFVGFEAAHYLFNSGKLFLCMYPKCTNSHHFRVIPSNAEMLRHEFTVPFDDFRFNIQYKYKQLLTSNPRTWPSIPELVQLSKRCLCEICGDFDSKLNQNQDMLHTYIEAKKPSIEEDNCENEHPTNSQKKSSWKKHLAHRFTSEDVEKQSIPQIIEDMERHIERFTHAFTIIFPLNKDMKSNLQHLQNSCESYPDAKDSDKSLNFECKEKLDIGHKCFSKDINLHSYQYSRVPNKVIPKPVLEELSNSSYQPPNQNLLATSHQFDEEHFPSEINRYFLKNTPSPSYQSMNLNLTSQSLKYVHKNISNTSHQADTPSTSHQSSIGNLTSSSHQPILNNFPATSHGISLDSCSSLNDRGPKYNHMSRYYSDGQMYTEIPHTYLQVPSAQFPNSSTNSYYGSSVNMPSDNSVPFCSPNLSINSVPNSPSSDCSIPSLVETVATAVPEHALLDDSLEAVNAAHNLMLISNRHRYNSTTSITSTKTTNTITVTNTATNNSKTVKNPNIITTHTKTNNISTTDTKVNNISPADTTTTNNISHLDTTNNNISSTCVSSGTLQHPITEPENQETDIVHNSRRKKKKKHDKKKDKKKKGKR